MKLSTISEQNHTIIGAHVNGKSNKENEKAFGNLIRDVEALGLKFSIKSGRWRNKREPALHIHGLSVDQAKKLMKKYKQEAIIYNGSITNRS